MVHTSETMRYRYFLDLLMANRRPVMLVSAAGCGKTVLLQDKLASESVQQGKGGESVEGIVCNSLWMYVSMY